MAIQEYEFPNLRNLAQSGALSHAGLIEGNFSKPIFEDIQWKEASKLTCHEWDTRISTGTEQKLFRQSISLGSLDDPKRLVETIFYGNPVVKPDGFFGLAAFFNTTDPSVAQCAINVFDGGGRGSANASIYLVGWSLRSVFMVYPPRPGRLIEDRDGKIKVESALIPFDWRFIYRIANIDVAASHDSQLDLYSAMTRAIIRFPHFSKDDVDPERIIRPSFYMNSKVWEILKTQTGLDGRDFRTIPIRVIDELRSDEPMVTGRQEKVA